MGQSILDVLTLSPLNVAGFVGGLIEGEHVCPSVTSVFFLSVRW